MTRPRSKQLIWVLSAVAFAVFGCGSGSGGQQFAETGDAATKRVVEESTSARPHAETKASSTAHAPHDPRDVVEREVENAGPATSTPAPVPVPAERNELTAEQLADRRLGTIDLLEPPPSDVFVSSIETPAPPEVIARSTWKDECPVDSTDLSYAQVSFYGFDGRFHTGELLLHNNVAEDIVGIFARLHDMRFPIEEMRVVSQADFENPIPDENNTTVFTCRRSVSSTTWSRHAHGDAIDINPFHNPYVSSSRVIPELATAYVDRDRDRPGLVDAEVRSMFSEIGWGWGGNWNSVKDWMHFSATGR